MTIQQAFAVLTIGYEMTDHHAQTILDKAMAYGDYFARTKGIHVINTNSGMPAEFRIETI